MNFTKAEGTCAVSTVMSVEGPGLLHAKRVRRRADDKFGAEWLQTPKPHFFSRLTAISGTSVPGIMIDTDWWLPRVIKVMFEVRPMVWATA